MDLTNITEILTAIANLDSSFSTFQKNTFTENVWYGKTAENANSLITDKIKTKITAAQLKLENLSQAIELARQGASYQEKIATTTTALANLDMNNSENASIYNYHQNNLNNYQLAYQNIINEINQLCN